MDLGCGPGTATQEISEHFDQAIGTDPSEGMIKQAQAKQQQASSETPPSNLSFRVASAESLPFLSDGSVDCIIAAEAAHWFDYQLLWPELSRVLRKNGTVAFWGYKDHVFVDHPAASRTLIEYAYDPQPDRMGSYWQQPGRDYLRDQLRVVQPPISQFGDVQRLEYEPDTKGKRSGQGTCFMEKRVGVGACKEYVRTWSAWHSWQEAHPDRLPRSQGGKGDVVDEMFDEMAKEEAQFADEENLVDIEWGSALVMARRI